MNQPSHPLNTVLLTLWRQSGHHIDALATCILIGGVNNFTPAMAHGVFHHPNCEDYHEMSLTELKAALRGLICWERTTTDTGRNRYCLKFVDALFHAYELAHQAWCGEPVDWHGFHDHILEPACEDQVKHWRKRRDHAMSQPCEKRTGPSFTKLRHVPLSSEVLMVENRD